jgi:hypothetical protein
MRFVCGDVRDLIVSYKTDHGPAHRRYRALQQWRCLKICFRGIFGIVRFSTFATISARTGHAAVVRRRLLLRVERTYRASEPTSDFDHKADIWQNTLVLAKHRIVLMTHQHPFAGRTPNSHYLA